MQCMLEKYLPDVNKDQASTDFRTPDQLVPKQVIENSVLFLHMRRNSQFINHKYTEKNLSKIKLFDF